MPYILIFMIFLLTACGSSEKQPVLTPMPDKFTDPPDSALLAPMADFIARQNAPLHSEWDLARTDLDGDGRRDAIVLFKLPHSYWCGWDGCGMLILKATNDGFVPVSTINSVRGPIYVSDVRTNNWRDIIVRVSGTNLRDKNIVMRYNGTTYPHTPLLAPDLEIQLSMLDTQRFFR